ncbi:MAG TPA: NAD(P)-dependent oxidoreductase [Gaiellaceae bacterium]|jgi:2-hydroxy-3-oxopropionate reductase|nr:NAD(P)-dependent oxidoreductase [Gaiellaceae bacterium]
MNERPTIGFVGLGAIGTPLARALVDAGHPLVAYDVDETRLDAIGRNAVTSAGSPREVAERAETVLVSLPTPDVVRQVACGADGLVLGGALRTYVDLSTTGAEVARNVAATLAKRNVDVVDAPVSGGVAGANAHTLAVMASGSDEAFARVEPLLRTFGKNVFHVGREPGQGQVAKLLNNLLSATAMAITSEALAVGTRAGLEPETLLEVLNAGSGRNTATADKFPTHVLPRTFGSGFRLALMAKDVELCLAEARAQRVPMLVGGLVQQLWTLAAAEGADDADHTEFVRLIEAWTGETVAGTSRSAA